MKLMIAEDDVLFQKVLAQVLAPDYEIVLACTGDEAWEILQQPSPPRLAILDWVMPGLSGPQICRKVRACERLKSMYLIIVTSKNNEADIVSGLRSGADDYITKPPIPAELRARARGGERILRLQDAVEMQSAAAARTFAGDRLLHEPRAAGVGKRAQNRSGGLSLAPRPLDVSESPDFCPVSCVDAELTGSTMAGNFIENVHSKR